MSTNDNQQLEIIHEYPVKEAISDGLIVDLTSKYPELVKDAGFVWKVLMTKRAFDRYVGLNEKAKKYHQSEKGRLWDILFGLYIAIKKCPPDETTLAFKINTIVPDEKDSSAMEISKNLLSDSFNQGDFDDEDNEDNEDNEVFRQLKTCFIKAVIGIEEPEQPFIAIMLAGED